jgi:hypothetical protein
MTPCRLHGYRWRWLIGSAHAHPSTTRYQRSITPMYHKLTRAPRGRRNNRHRSDGDRSCNHQTADGAALQLQTSKWVGAGRRVAAQVHDTRAPPPQPATTTRTNQPIRQTHPETPFRGGVGWGGGGRERVLYSQHKH